MKLLPGSCVVIDKLFKAKTLTTARSIANKRILYLRLAVVLFMLIPGCLLGLARVQFCQICQHIIYIYI